MPRVIHYTPMECGALRRDVVITWTRQEVLARIQKLRTFKHKRLVAKQWRQQNDTICTSD